MMDSVQTSFSDIQYAKPYLTFSIENQNESFDPFLQDNQFDKTENFNKITDIDLLTFTQRPITSLALIMPIQLTFAASAIFIQIRTLQMLKQESSVNNQMMVSQARLHILFWPSFVVVNTLTDNIYPLSNLLTSHFCSVFSFFLHFCFYSMILYSLYAALLRYLYCVHSEKVEKFGKTKFITLMYWMFYGHVLLWTGYTMLTTFNLDHLPLINSCYGVMDKLWMMEGSLLEMVQRHFCVLESTEGRNAKPQI